MRYVLWYLNMFANLPDRKLIVELSTLSSRLDISIKFHKRADQCGLSKLMVHNLQFKKQKLYFSVSVERS